jgi:SAM-dependent methyltransferase
MSNDWKTYIQQTTNSRPRPLTVEALTYVTTGKQALDIGAGGLNDTKFLIEKGFHVTAFDQESFTSEIAQGLPVDNITSVIKPFSEYSFPENSFDFITSQLSLPFQTKEEFLVLFPKIVLSLKENGVFAFDLFGNKDDWNKAGLKDRFFVEKSDIDSLLQNYKNIIKSEEKEWDGRTAAGQTKHWHTFEIILRK